MALSYKPLWKLLIDKGINKGDLAKTAGISHNVIAKMGRDEYVSLQVLDRICCALNCDFSDIVTALNKGDERDA